MGMGVEMTGNRMLRMTVAYKAQMLCQRVTLFLLCPANVEKAHMNLCFTWKGLTGAWMVMLEQLQEQELPAPPMVIVERAGR